MSPGALDALRAVNRWHGRYRCGLSGAEMGRAEAQRTVRAAGRHGLSVSAVATAGRMTVTCGPAIPEVRP